MNFYSKIIFQCIFIVKSSSNAFYNKNFIKCIFIVKSLSNAFL